MVRFGFEAEVLALVHEILVLRTEPVPILTIGPLVERINPGDWHERSFEQGASLLALSPISWYCLPLNILPTLLLSLVRPSRLSSFLDDFVGQGLFGKPFANANLDPLSVQANSNSNSN